MARVIILGTSNAIPHKDHDNTHFIVMGEERAVLVDCSGNPIVRFEQAGIDFNDITDLVATHFHPDHISGVPSLLMDMWLMGRRRPLNIYGLHHTLDRLEALMGFFEWEKWPGFFPTAFVRLPASELTTALDCPDFKVIASPVEHFIPTIGLRVEFKNQKVFAYSCDTEPCEQVVRLAAGANVLMHESSGSSRGHSSAQQAAETAARAAAKRLLLVHYPTGAYRTTDLIADARGRFQGEVALAEDFMTLEF